MTNAPTVFIVDDDEGIREALRMLLETVGLRCEVFGSAAAFLDAYRPTDPGCLVLDIRMPGMSGLELQGELERKHSSLPIVFITGHADVPMAVEAMRRGALDFIRKPFREQELLDRINEALSCDASQRDEMEHRQRLLARIDALSPRERQVFERVAAGDMNKVIASDLGISERTVEVHRAKVMKKLQVSNLAQVVRAKIAADMSRNP